jgi:hypothetical protein
MTVLFGNVADVALDAAHSCRFLEEMGLAIIWVPDRMKATNVRNLRDRKLRPI